MGLPGAGKTTLAKKLVKKIDAAWINADDVRNKFNDWDFSKQGRLRQAKRMKNLADTELKKSKTVVADFVCPTEQTRDDFNPDILIWVDTIKKGRFEDTNQMFIEPIKFDLRVKTKDSDYWCDEILKILKKK